MINIVAVAIVGAKGGSVIALIIILVIEVVVLIEIEARKVVVFGISMPS